MFTFTRLLLLLGLIICVLLSAFFAFSEAAFYSLPRMRLQQMVNTNVKGSRRIAVILEKPEKFISTLRLGDNFVDATAAAFATTLAISLWGEQLGIVIATFGLTGITLIFGDTAPKTIATRHSERVALAVARPFQWVSWLLSPFVVILSGVVSVVTRSAGAETMPQTFTSPEEIRALISLGHKEGTVEKDEAEMLHNVFEFGDRPVRDIMVTRLDIVGIEKGSRIAHYLAVYAQDPYSRMPVYEDNLDNIIGIISDKDVLTGLAKETIKPDAIVDDLIRPAYFTPDSKLISDLFREMREKNYWLAVVVDEYGGTAGILTLNRMAQEVMGKFRNELAAIDNDFEEINEFTYHVDGSARIENFKEETGFELPEGNYETVAGFILNRLGHIPKEGDQLRYRDLKLSITRMRGFKIDEVLITRDSPATPKR